LDPPGSNPPSSPSLSLLQEHHGKLLRTTPSAPSLKLSPTGSEEPHRRQPPLAAACKDLDLQPQGKPAIRCSRGTAPARQNLMQSCDSVVQLLQGRGALPFGTPGAHRRRQPPRPQSGAPGVDTFRETSEGVRQCRRRGWHCYRGAVPARSPL
jgi:hypothetical protein